MKQPFFHLSTILLVMIPLFLSGTEKGSRFTHPELMVSASRVVPGTRSTGKVRAALVLHPLRSEEKNATDYLLEDENTLRHVEDARFLLLSDFTGRSISNQNIRLRFQGARIRGVVRSGHVFGLITAYDTLTWAGDSENPVSFEALHPVCPKEDATHHYIEVPVSYSHPEGETFRLYYEVNKDFNPLLPTIMIPTDAQRSFSQVGWADRYKKIFSTRLNVVIFEYRGTFCSPVSGLSAGDTDWKQAYRVFHSDNVVEDMERIRRHLVGDRPIHILGGSGTAMMGLKYLAKYHSHVKRAYLMSFFRDAEGSSRAGIQYFSRFLKTRQLKEKYLQALERSGNPDQLIFLLQRLLYFRPDQAHALIDCTARGDDSLFRTVTGRFGPVEYLVRSTRRYRPWTVVFMYETNIDTTDSGPMNINAPFFEMGRPLLELEDQGRIRKSLFSIKGLEKVSTEVLLLAGTRDPVAPLEEMERIHRALPNSRLAVFNAGHCLQMDPGARQCRNHLVDLFFLHGFASREFAGYLDSCGEKGKFLELR